MLKKTRRQTERELLLQALVGQSYVGLSPLVSVIWDHFGAGMNEKSPTDSTLAALSELRDEGLVELLALFPGPPIPAFKFVRVWKITFEGWVYATKARA